MALAEQILANEKVMDRLAKEYAQVLGSYYGNGKRGNDTEAKKDMIYVLEQEFGVCMSPSSIGSQLAKIWDKIQMLAKERYGYEGPIYQPKSDELPEYLVAKAEKIRSNERVMRALGQRWCWFQQDKGHLAKGAMMSKDYYGSYPNTLIDYSEVVGLYLGFGEAKQIVRFLKNDIKKYGKMIQAEEETKRDELTEAIYKSVLKKILKNG